MTSKQTGLLFLAYDHACLKVEQARRDLREAEVRREGGSSIACYEELVRQAVAERDRAFAAWSGGAP